MNRLIKSNLKISIENKLIQLDDIVQHKKYVIDVCSILAKYFIKHNNDVLALDIMNQAFIHDISKLSPLEFYGYSLNSGNWKKGEPPEETQKAIDSHYSHNPHHPEYWTNINEMTELDIIEMTCDWYARGLQFNTDFWEYYANKLKPKYNFSQNIELQIKKYYDILNNNFNIDTSIETNSGVSIENKLIQLDDIIQHKKYVIDTCSILAKYFIKYNNDILALAIMNRAFIHDTSKLNADEFYGMAKFATDVESLTDPNKKISVNKEEIIKLHWSRNSHHPEYWKNINKMPELDIIEMACDWYARSLQFNTNCIEFIKIKQKNRFHFPESIYNKLYNYLIILEKETL